jgi:hypothetical protein
MSGEEFLRTSFAAVEVSADFSEAVVTMRDGSRLCFCHRVGERWAKAVGPPEAESAPGLASSALAQIVLFRLNAKHLDVQLADGGRWEVRFKDTRRESDADPETAR